MAQVDYFLKLDGIKGESADHKHKDEIHLESWSWGETNASSGHTGGGHGAGKVSMQDFHFVAQMSKASPELMLACATGKHLKEALLTCRKAGGDQNPFFTIKLSDVLISSYQTGGSASSEIVPVDQVSLTFTKIEHEYKPQDAKGATGSPVKAGYDLLANKKL